MSDPNKYTMGWICALQAEAVPVSILLGEEHSRPLYVYNHDSNVYQLGSMAGHNVVIASLPYGEYGTASAARTASDTLNSFPTIRMGLLVGIAGGARSPKNDIRLGDIVVGVSTDGENGVFQYDYGKAVQERKFQVTRVLDPSPNASSKSGE